MSLNTRRYSTIYLHSIISGEIVNMFYEKTINVQPVKARESKENHRTMQLNEILQEML